MGEWIRFGLTAICLITALIGFTAAVIGANRFGFVMNRMHAAGIGDTLGIFGVVCAVMLREGDGTDSVYGIVFSDDIFSAIPLLSAPGGESAAELTGGTQIKILEEKDGFCRVTTGLDEGWAAQENILIVPEKKEGN